LRPVVNATGVVLHTNLGRAPLADVALRAIDTAARGYSNLEYDIEQGARGSRHDHCRGLLAQLTGAQDALVVNNNAAALILAMNTLAAGREAVISRGELVEIGGSFRVPEILARSGARMVDVGTTNRTHLEDYRRALGPRTALLLQVHPSNFRVSGFTASVALGDLVALGAEHDIPVVNDLGSGLLLDAAALGLPHEPTPAEALRAGAAVVTMSGDKLLGGPQAGLVLGQRRYVEAMRRNPLCRALRVDKLTLAALEATLRLYRDEPHALTEIPTLRMLAMPASELAERADGIATRLREFGLDAETRDGESVVGGGAFPIHGIPARLVCVAPPAGSAEQLERALRLHDPPVITRIADDRVVIDPRTLQAGELDIVVRAVFAATRPVD
jgi:L-seryl-tRNA(Ser) seleniumtransferase